MRAARAIDQLIDCQGALIHALDAGDVGAVERATAQVAQVLDLVRHEHIANPDDRGRFDYALRQAEVARGRVNFLKDRATQRIERLMQRRGSRIVNIYTSHRKSGQSLRS